MPHVKTLCFPFLLSFFWLADEELLGRNICGVIVCFGFVGFEIYLLWSYLTDYSTQHGEIDCWPLTCPKLTCQNAIQRPGECCPVCEDSNPCVSLTLETGGQDLSQTTCTYMGTSFSHGEEWQLESDRCTSCQCKVSIVVVGITTFMIITIITITKITIIIIPFLERGHLTVWVEPARHVTHTPFRNWF